MTTWTPDELDAIAEVDEVQIASVRRDGTLSNARTIWSVRLGDELYVRSVNGPGSGWFRATRQRHEGHVHAGRIDKDVTFVDADHAIDDQIDDAYRTKYRRYAQNIVESVITGQARSTTLKLLPR